MDASGNQRLDPMDTSPLSQADVRHRPLQDDTDVKQVRMLLQRTYATTPLGFNWDVRRWDGQRYYQPDPALDAAWRAKVRIWETPAPELVAAVCLEDDAGATRTLNLLIDPDWRALEAELLAWAEAASFQEGSSRVQTLVWDYDAPRQNVLAARSYAPTPHTGVIRRMRLTGRQWDMPAPPAGYTLRTTHSTQEDAQQIADLLNAAFNRDFHNPQEYLTFARHAPSFRPDLDLVAVAPDGQMAAYAGVPYDAENRYGIFEPVCTHPHHRRRGLAQALMVEGLRRLQALGAETVTVETGDAEAANRLYDALGFDEVVRGVIWEKEAPPVG